MLTATRITSLACGTCCNFFELFTIGTDSYYDSLQSQDLERFTSYFYLRLAAIPCRRTASTASWPARISAGRGEATAGTGMRRTAGSCLSIGPTDDLILRQKYNHQFYWCPRRSLLFVTTVQVEYVWIVTGDCLRTFSDNEEKGTINLIKLK